MHGNSSSGSSTPADGRPRVDHAGHTELHGDHHDHADSDYYDTQPDHVQHHSCLEPVQHPSLPRVCLLPRDACRRRDHERPVDDYTDNTITGDAGDIEAVDAQFDDVGDSEAHDDLSEHEGELDSYEESVAASIDGESLSERGS